MSAALSSVIIRAIFSLLLGAIGGIVAMHFFRRFTMTDEEMKAAYRQNVNDSREI